MPKILYFEDDMILRAMYTEKFRLSGFDCVAVDSPGDDPIALVLKEQPDAIVMDVLMPTMDGFEATRRIKADPRIKHIPLLFLTTHGQKEEIDRGIQLGAAAYMIKAHKTPQEVVDEVRRILGIPVPPGKKVDPHRVPAGHKPSSPELPPQNAATLSETKKRELRYLNTTRNAQHFLSPVPAVIAAGLLLLGLAPWPYGYYSFLRIVVILAALYYLWPRKPEPRTFEMLGWPLVVVAILYNPIWPIYLYDKGLWSVIDVVVAVFLMVIAKRRVVWS